MANYIEQLMKAAGVQKREIIDCCLPQEYFECQDKHNCAYCDKCRSIEHSAFTPPKQLELIKLLFKAVPTRLNPYFEPVKNSDKWQYIHTDLSFEDALAEMVWNALTVLDKTEVKKILEE